MSMFEQYVQHPPLQVWSIFMAYHGGGPEIRRRDINLYGADLDAERPTAPKPGTMRYMSSGSEWMPLNDGNPRARDAETTDTTRANAQRGGSEAGLLQSAASRYCGTPVRL